MNAITTVPMPLSYDALERLAESIAKSGLFGMKTKDQAIALMMIAHAEGTHPALAARDYDVIQGKPAKKAEAMMRDFIAAGGKVEWHSLTDDLADATFTHPQTGSVRISWDMERAKVAGFAGKDNWKKFPRAMLRSRVVSEGVRTIWPLATSGLYVPEEVADTPGKAEHNGPTLEHDAREAINAEVPLKAAASDIKRADKIADKAKVYDTGAETDEEKWWRNLEIKFATAQTQAEVMKVGELKSVKDARENGPTEVRERVLELMANAYARFPNKTWTPDLSDGTKESTGEELPDVVIAGADKVAAG